MSERKIRSKASITVILAGAGACVAACATVLGIEDVERMPTQGLDAGADAQGVDVASQDGTGGQGGAPDAADAADAAQDVSGEDGSKPEASGDATGCDGAMKLCSGSCVSTEDPQTGCASADCMPCGSGPQSTATCVAGACELQCDTGFGDCDTQSATGCEANLNADDKNCGSCGHSCLGGTCKAGKCNPTKLIDEGKQIRDLALDADLAGNVYWVAFDDGAATQGTVNFLKKSATGFTNLLSGQNGPVAVASDGVYTYFSTSDNIVWRQDNAKQSAPFKLWSGSSSTQASALSADSTYVYWYEDGTIWPRLHRIEKIGGTDVWLVVDNSVQFFTAIAATADTFYYGTPGPSGQIKSRSKSGPGNAVVIASDGSGDAGSSEVSDLAVDDTHVYWVSHLSGALKRKLRTGAGSVEKLQTYPTLSSSIGAIAVDSTSVWYTVSTLALSAQTLYRLDKAAPTKVTSMVSLASSDPKIKDLMVDDAAVYWYTDHTVQRLAK